MYTYMICDGLKQVNPTVLPKMLFFPNWLKMSYNQATNEKIWYNYLSQKMYCWIMANLGTTNIVSNLYIHLLFVFDWMCHYPLLQSYQPHWMICRQLPHFLQCLLLKIIIYMIYYKCTLVAMPNCRIYILLDTIW